MFYLIDVLDQTLVSMAEKLSSKIKIFLGEMVAVTAFRIHLAVVCGKWNSEVEETYQQLHDHIGPF